MPTGVRIDPLRSYHYHVEIDGIQAGGFSEASGLNAKRDMVEYRNGNDIESHTRKLTGRDSYDNVTLKRGYTRDDTFWRWFAALSAGVNDVRNVTITLHDEARNPVLSWVLERTMIVSLMGPGLTAAGNEIAIETIELSVEKVTMELEGSAA